MIERVKEINKDTKRNYYVMLAGNNMFASTSKINIDDYLKSDDSIITPFAVDIEDVCVLYGFLMAINELPYELTAEAKDKDRSLWLIIDDGNEIEFKEFDTLYEVTEAIALTLKQNPSMDISDCAVLLGIEEKLVMTVTSEGSYLGESAVYK